MSTQASIRVYVAHRSLRTLSERFASSLAVVSLMGASTSRITVSNPQSVTIYVPIHTVTISHCRLWRSIQTPAASMLAHFDKQTWAQAASRMHAHTQR